MNAITIYPEDGISKWSVEVRGVMMLELVDELKRHGFKYKLNPSRWVGSDRKLFSVYKNLQSFE